MPIVFDISQQPCEGLLPHLAVDTSQNALSVALVVQDQLWSIHQSCAQKQSDLLLPSIEALLSAANLNKRQMAAAIEYIAVGEGPGSFVGVRLGVSAAQGLSQAWRLPVRTVNTLELLAWQYRHTQADNAASVCSDSSNIITVAIDARMNQVYAAMITFDKDTQQATLILPGQLLDPAQLVGHWQALGEVNQRHFVGNGFSAYPELIALAGENALIIAPEAKFMGACLSKQMPGWVPSAEMQQRVPVPNYIRNQVADKPAQ